MGVTDPDAVLEVSIQGTRSVLASALTEPSIKSVVLMSSIAAMTGIGSPSTSRVTEADWNDAALDAVKKLGKESSGPLIYIASKVAGERAFWKFRDEEKPSFTMTALNPT